MLRLLLAIAVVALSQQASAQTAPELIERWYEHNNICRGSTDASRSLPACERRERIGRQLDAMGLCYGVLSYGYNSKWEICSPSKGQTVAVKNVGQMNLSSFECRLIDDSSFISRVCYEMERDILVIRLNGTYYAYCDIELSDAMQFVAANSKGKYFNANFRGRKECR